ncbi:MAG TPA: GNAT family N-acetyltransferase, partial [Cyclobacteriaceae bacterium]|nr:GNAT family N-acetyltransferase [Cyclobacteriaceae bacterium]
RNVIRRAKKMMGVQEPIANAAELPDPHTGLIVIGVDPAVQGKGYGSQLLQEFERVSRGLNFKKMMLTVRTQNEQAIRSYLRNGWETTKVEGASTTMEKQLN